MANGDDLGVGPVPDIQSDPGFAGYNMLAPPAAMAPQLVGSRQTPLVGGDPVFNTTNPLVPNQLTTPVKTPGTDAAQAGPNINDISETDRLTGHGMFQSNPTGMIIHHTGSNEGGIDALVNTFQQSPDHLNSQFAIDRNGQIYQLLPNGTVGYHIKPGWGPQGQGRSNSNMEGVEVIAAGDKDVTPAQQQAAAQLVAARSQMWGWDPKTNVFGHGEVNPGWKQADEGLTIANGIRTGSLQLPNYSGVVNPMMIQNGQLVASSVGSTGPVSLMTPMSGGGTTQANQLAPQQLAPVKVPDNVAPYLNYWADYHGLDRNIFARMIQHENPEWNPAKLGPTPESKGGPEVGLGQLMPATSQYLKVSDPTDINENLRGSAQYLREMLNNPKTGGDYRKALMLYNSGPGGNFNNPEYADAVLGGKIGSDYAAGGYGGVNMTDPYAAGAGLRNALGLQAGEQAGPRQLTPEEQAFMQAQQQALNRRNVTIPQGYMQLPPPPKLAPTTINYDPKKATQAGEVTPYRPVGDIDMRTPKVGTAVAGQGETVQSREAARPQPLPELRRYGKSEPVPVVSAGLRSASGTPAARRFYVRPIATTMYRDIVQ